MADQEQQTPETPEKGFTQEDLNKIAAKEKREGQQAAINDLLQKTGAESLEEVIAAYSDYQGIQEAVTTEAERAQKEERKLQKKVADANARAEQAETLAETRLVDAEMRTALIDAGVPAARVGSALKLLGRDGLSVKDGKVEGHSEAVEALKGSDSYLFEAPTQTVPRTAPEVDAKPRAPVDVSTMSGEEFGKLQNQVMSGAFIVPDTSAPGSNPGRIP